MTLTVMRTNKGVVVQVIELPGGKTVVRSPGNWPYILPEYPFEWELMEGPTCAGYDHTFGQGWSVNIVQGYFELRMNRRSGGYIVYKKELLQDLVIPS